MQYKYYAMPLLIGLLLRARQANARALHAFATQYVIRASF